MYQYGTLLIHKDNLSVDYTPFDGYNLMFGR